jgi:hypothetical protein
MAIHRLKTGWLDYVWMVGDPEVGLVDWPQASFEFPIIADSSLFVILAP